MTCCGGRRASSILSTTRAESNERWIVESLHEGPITIYGPATGRAYRFTMRGARLEVAASDRVAWLHRSDFKIIGVDST